MENLELKIRDFVTPFYAKKDLMHDLSHIDRVIKRVSLISYKYSCNNTVLICGAYLHGIINNYYDESKEFLEKEINDTDLINRIIICAEESNKSSSPESLEGKIIHDAHLLEGGIYYGIIKSFITGSLRNQTLNETMDYYKNNILNKFKCAIPENQKQLDELYKTSEEIIKDIRKNI